MSASHPYPILDSHIHLCPGPSLDTLAWHDSHLPPGSPPNPLSAKAFSVSQFRDAVRRSPVLGRSVRGAIVVESDRWTEDHARDKAPQNDDGATEEDIDSVPDEKLKQRWSGPLAELAFLSRLVAGKPEPLDDFVPSDSGIVAAIVAWAPVSSGPKVLARYLRIARDVAGDDCWTRVKGFRFLLQDKPPRTMLRRQFVEGVAFLATKGYTFDVGVDHHRRGRQQLDECVEMVGRVQDLLKERGENPATFILNHLLKPDLTILNTHTDPAFIAWRSSMYALAKYPTVYLKLSGLFSEMPAALRRRDATTDIFFAMQPWLAVALATFGAGNGRIMFASDWPICTIGVDGEAPEPRVTEGKEVKKSGDDEESEGKGEEGEPDGGGAWNKWAEIVRRMCSLASLSDADQRRIWLNTAAEAYGVGRAVPGSDDEDDEDEEDEDEDESDEDKYEAA